MPQHDPQSDPPPQTEYDTLPPALAEALREMDGPAVMPDARRDAEVLSGARRHLAETAGRSRKRRNRRLFIGGAAGGALAAAAMVGIVVLIGEPTGQEDAAPDIANQSAPQRSSEPTAPAGDLNADRRLDILDAYTLAKQIERGDASDNADLNGDGRIDQQDIDWIAHRAVALNLGGQG